MSHRLAIYAGIYLGPRDSVTATDSRDERSFIETSWGLALLAFGFLLQLVGAWIK